MLPHTALRTARPSWQPAAPVPVSEPGRRAVGRQRGPGRPWGRRGSAGPAVRGSGGPQPRTRIRWARQCAPCTGRAEGRAVEGARMHPQPPGAYGARTRGGYGPDMVEGASRRGAGGSRRRGRVRGSVTPVGPRARQIGGRGSFTSAGRGRGRVSSRASHVRGAVRNRAASRTVHRRSQSVPQALPGRSQDGQVRGACASGMREGGHSRWGVAALVVPRGHAPSAGCLGADRPRRCCPGGYLPLAASLSFEPAETFTL